MAVNGALTLPTSGNVVLNLADAGGLAPGTYKLFNAANVANFTPSVFSVGSSPLPSYLYEFASTGSEIDLTIITGWSAAAVDNNWANSANWYGGIVPGATTGVTSTDTATFATSGNGHVAIVPDANRNVQSISFDTPSAAAYTIGTVSGGNPLYLTDGGTIRTTSTVVNTETINAPLILEGANTSYTITSGSADNNAVLDIGGSISGGAAGTTTLTFNGANTGDNTVSGAIADGSATSLAVVKGGAGTWILSAANSYSGGTTVNNGLLRLDAANTSAGPTAINAGQLLLNHANAVQNSTVTVGAANGLLFGPNIGAFNLGALGGGGNLVLADSNSNAVTLNVGQNGASTTYSGVLSGPGSLTKTGSGVMTLASPSTNLYTGPTVISGGTLQLAMAQALPPPAPGWIGSAIA